MSTPRFRPFHPPHATGWVSTSTLLGGLLVLSGTAQSWGSALVFFVQLSTAAVAAGVVLTHLGETPYTRKVAAISLLLIVAGAAAAVWTLTTGTAWPTILAGAAQLGWATGPTHQQNEVE